MDSTRSSPNENLTLLADCVSEEMTARQAADAAEDCWVQAEAVITPIIGPDGVGLLARKGEEEAVRTAGVAAPRELRASVAAFFEWAGSLAKPDALSACKAFLGTVERYLVSLFGLDRARRMLARVRRSK